MTNIDSAPKLVKPIYVAATDCQSLLQQHHISSHVLNALGKPSESVIVIFFSISVAVGVNTYMAIIDVRKSRTFRIQIPEEMDIEEELQLQFARSIPAEL